MTGTTTIITCLLITEFFSSSLHLVTPTREEKKVFEAQNHRDRSWNWRGARNNMIVPFCMSLTGGYSNLCWNNSSWSSKAIMQFKVWAKNQIPEWHVSQGCVSVRYTKDRCVVSSVHTTKNCRTNNRGKIWISGVKKLMHEMGYKDSRNRVLAPKHFKEWILPHRHETYRKLSLFFLQPLYDE